MRQITSHHDGHGLNDAIEIFADEKAQGGASHKYTLKLEGEVIATIQFQQGARKEPGSIPGATENAILAVVADRIQCFQEGPFGCRENAIGLTHLETAMLWSKKRADDRARRGVLGKELK